MRELRRWMLLLSVLLWLLSAPGATAGEDEPRIPRGTMPEAAYSLLREVAGSFDYPKGRSEWRERNLAALDQLRRVPLPQFDELQRLRVKLKTAAQSPASVWGQRIDARKLLLLLPDFTERSVQSEAFETVEEVSYEDELEALGAWLKNRDPADRRPWDFTYFVDLGANGLPYHGGVFVLHHAFAAAILGHEETARALVTVALQQRGLSFEQALNEGAWHSFQEGIRLLQSGAARKLVLAQWKSTYEIYGNSRYREQLTDLIAELEQQVPQDDRLAASEVEDPEALPLKERIAYHTARFVDVRGAQWGQPGMCATTRCGEGTRHSDAIVKIGRPAIPTLIALLGDRRITRSIGFWRDFAPDRIILRVEDVALECIVSILDVRFWARRTTSSYLSREEPEYHDAVIADIKAWWAKHGSEPEIEGFLARLDTGHLSERLRVLRQIEKIDASRLDSIATLKRWAVEFDARQLPRIAEELARRGDLTLLPEIRERASRPSIEVAAFLMRHGDADDFRALREAASKDLAGGARLGNPGAYGAVVGAARGCDRPLAVPLHVDFLSQRQITGSRMVAGSDKSVGFGVADTSMESLIRITGHDEGYVAYAPAGERFAAIDRWISWWKQEGEKAFLAKHPEVLQVVVPPTIPAAEVDLSKATALIDVREPDPTAPLTYQVPRANARSLLLAGAILAVKGERGSFEFRFRSTADARAWLLRAVPVHPEDGKQVLDGVELLFDRLSFRHIVPGTEGRVWTQGSKYKPDSSLVRPAVEAAKPNTVTAVVGASVLHVDRQGVVWLSYQSPGPILEGYDRARERWLSLPPDDALGIVAPDRATGEGRRFRSIYGVYQSRRGLLYFVDPYGVYTKDGERWTYERLVPDEPSERTEEGHLRSFHNPRFAEDTSGRVFLWSGAQSPARGFWIHDGGSWRRELAVEHVAVILPRTDKSILLIDDRAELHLLREKRLTSGSAVVAELFPNYRFVRARVRARGADGVALLMAEPVTVVEPIEKRGSWGMILPPDAPGTELSSAANALLSTRYQNRGQVVGSDGWIWIRHRDGLEGISPDGQSVRALPQARDIGNAVGAVDRQGRLYVTSDTRLWRVDPAVALERQDVSEPLLPGVVARVRGVYPAQDGRLWCTWSEGHALGILAEGIWAHVEPPAEIAGRNRRWDHVQPGRNGSAILWSGSEVCLVDREGWVQAESAVELVRKHKDRVLRALPEPGPGIIRRSRYNLRKDAENRVWWSRWRTWGVVDTKTGQAVQGNSEQQKEPAFCRCPEGIIPVGDGTRMLLVEGEGWPEVRILRLADGAIHEVKRHSHASSSISWRLPDAMALRDESGRTWFTNGRRSWAFDKAGELVLLPKHERWGAAVDATITGSLLAAGPDGVLWFRSSRGKRLLRVGPDLKLLSSIELNELAANAEPTLGAVAGESFWVLTDLALLRLKASDGAYAPAGQYSRPLNASELLMQDSGLLWAWSSTAWRDVPMQGFATGRHR
jgi:hypothetical protein